MPFNSADVEILRQAIRDRGFVRSLAFSDQNITFDSIDDMLKLLAIMQQEVRAESGTNTSTRYAATRKGV